MSAAMIALSLSVALLIRPVSGQFLGGIGQIAGKIKESTPAKIANVVSKSTEEAASELLSSKDSRRIAQSIGSVSLKDAAEVIKKRSTDGIGRAAEAAEDAHKLEEQSEEALRQAGLPPASVPASSTREPLPAIRGSRSRPETKDPRKADIVDALASMGGVLDRATDTLNRTSMGEMKGALKKTGAQELAKAVEAAVRKSPAEAVEPESLKKAESSIEDAKAALGQSREAGTIKSAGEELAKAIGVEKTLERTQPAVADALQKAPHVVTDALHGASAKDVTKVLEERTPDIAEAFRSGDLDQILEAVRGTGRKHGLVLPALTAETVSSWRWVLIAVPAAGFALLAGCCLTRRRAARSPKLRGDSGISMTARGGQLPSGPEEPLFRQF